MKPDYIVVKDILKDEYTWLEEDIKKGTGLYRYHGHTYGCISFDGVACTLTRDKNASFFEVPLSHIVPSL